ncbi:shikimate dehydrogenase [Herbiconiux sp.]|uniref:shikimate dehydrogenase n=1 Tax=Herbiconiux sp. TaxID=1871186 RepID=UPI0025BEAE63|nr:shikimate dehydrogenase [Herbiconiux sp.]
MTRPSPDGSRQLGVLGSPIAHSRSPLLHRTAYAALGLTWEYDAYDVPADALDAFVAGLGPEWRGLSLTMPLKETVIPLLDSMDAVARATGAVNTVLVTFSEEGRRLDGFNTDVFGIREALRRAGVESSMHAVVIGGGATARSAVAAVAQLGAEHVDIVLRSPEKAGDVVETARASGLSTSVVALHDRSAVAALEPDLTISTLPGGVGAGETVEGLALTRSSALLDVAYHPWPSELATVWEASGGEAVPGLAMLAHQAIAQIRIFTGGDPLLPLPNEEALTASLLKALALPA